MEISIKWNMCRVCLLEENQKPNAKYINDVGSSKSSVGSSVGSGTHQLVHLFSDPKVPQQILECTGISMKPNDCMPDKICRKCLMLLKYTLQFTTTCRNSDEYLQTVLQKAKSATSIARLDRRRVATLELMDSIFHENEDNLENDDDVEDLLENESADALEQLAAEEREIIGDNFIEKKSRLQIENPKQPGCKKLKIERTSNDNEEISSPNDMEYMLITGTNTKETKPREDPLEMNLEHVWNNSETHERRLSSNDKLNAEDIELLMDDEEQDMDESYMEELEENSCNKQRAVTKSTSECSIDDDGYVEYGEEEQGVVIIAQHEVKNRDIKPLIIIEEVGREQEETDYDETGIEKYMTSTIEMASDDAEEQTTNTIVDDDEGEMGLFYVLGGSNDVKKEYKSDSESNIDETNTVIERVAQFEDDDSNNDDDIDDTLLKTSRHIKQKFPVRTKPSLTTVSEYIIDENGESSHLNSENNEPNITETTPPRKSSNNIGNAGAAAAIGASKSPVAAVTIKVGTRRATAHTRKKVGDVYVYVCEICGNQFTNRNLMNYHMRIHRNEKNYECELCFKRFSAACNLTAHMRIHTGEKPYECQFCKRRFTDRSTHIKHERIHTNERPFQCNICGKAFSLSTTLRAHEKVHSGEKPFKCEPCSKSFKLPHQLKAHMKTHLHILSADHN